MVIGCPALGRGYHLSHVYEGPPRPERGVCCLFIKQKKNSFHTCPVLVGGKGLLMSLSQNDRPTDPTDRPDPYYQYRLTVPHERLSDVVSLVSSKSNDWALCQHFPDDEDKQEHFHVVMRDFCVKKVDAFKKHVVKFFARAGNALHAGKFQTNHVAKAIGYFKHDEHATFHHSGQAYWNEYWETEPAFVKSGKPKVFKESMSHPVLTYANVLKQAVKYQREHCPALRTLSEVVELMVNEHNWWPSRELLTNGIPAETHERFSDMVTAKRTRLSFWLPHERSEKKLEWIDRVSIGWYPTGVSSTGAPGDSRHLWTGKDLSKSI